VAPRFFVLSFPRPSFLGSGAARLGVSLNYFEDHFTRDFTSLIPTDARDPNTVSLQDLRKKEGLKTRTGNCEQGATGWMCEVLDCDDTASIFQNLQAENTSQTEVEPYVCIKLQYLLFPPMLNLMCQ